MQIRRAQPQAIERQIGVAVGLDEIFELMGRADKEICQLVFAEFLRIGSEPVRVGAEFAVRLDLTDCFAGERIALRILKAMAGAALAHENVAAARHRPRIWMIRAWRCPQRLEPIGHAVDAVEVDRIRRDAGPDSRREITFSQRGVVAVPMQMHVFTRTLVKDRREVGDADQLILLQ